MNVKKRFSILFPNQDNVIYKQLSETTCHDLGLDILCSELSLDKREQNIIMNIISNMTSDKETAYFRQKVFSDILRLPDLRKKLSDLFDRIEYIRKFNSGNLDTDEKLGFWLLMHRLDELSDYIKCVEAMRECLSSADIQSEGLIAFRNYLDLLYEEARFNAMKKDIAELKSSTSVIQSVTLGVNVNSRFEAVSLGLVSVNSKPFKKSNIVSNFADAIADKDKIQDNTDWDGDMHYHQVDKDHSKSFAKMTENITSMIAVTGTPFVDGRIRSTVVQNINNDISGGATFYLDKVMNRMLGSIIRKLRNVLTEYADIAIVDISNVIPEFMYYIKFAEFIEKLKEKGFNVCEAQLSDKSDVYMDSKGLYNLKLALNLESSDEIVYNDLVFDNEHNLYILTGANRGGKTTITQAVGLLYVLAQGGISVPASSFSYKPVDCIYTHFPADEDKTLDLGRLGEECVRFKELYSQTTSDSLVLLNETFSTTSFEEGFYIAKDSVRALMKKGIRTIYNTHMHKLATEIDELNSKSEIHKAASLIVKNEDGKRSFKVEIAPPEGLSYAKDIAEKYGVTYEMLTNDQ
ncbi:DNA mismatch repair protein [Ruminococcus sp.]|uniref:MutS-related protein n=1 Tax=Ruminococcus sp. TaxID=41978 RepID=UPI0025EE6363|nr:DNA mismatch repair protein [Ruminococcus sp.]